ncbi:CRE-NPP-15 protein [Caenorhabditis remanei]|uniref:CRE-NPP-15 protein n=1 Tax=Caenorhabditis remanei TaxID=31234 RepID=E3MKY2_CAERE|nr:CRE-NPP-15 protein [Caenorhabditis remanei]
MPLPEPYTHVKMVTDKELELTLDKVPIEYPALVKEAFLNNWHASAHQTEVTTNCASLNDRHCWVLSRNQMFIWERAKTSHRATNPTQLPLPTSGLPRSAKCVVVYDSSHISQKTKLPIPAVLIISPEGVLRHWPSIESQNYIEKTLDINSEVALRVQITDQPVEGKSASFLLTTTSGTIYFLSGEGSDSGKTGALTCTKVIGRDSRGFRRRLSSIMFGGQEDTSLVMNSFQYDTKAALLVVTISTDAVSVYNMLTPKEVWTLRADKFFQPKVCGFFESDLKRIANLVKCQLIDAAVFRDGLLVLVGGTHEDSNQVHMFTCWFGPNWQTEEPKEIQWSARITLNEYRSVLGKNDPSVYSSLTICIPEDTANSKSADRTDGIIFLHSFFALSVYLPINLMNPPKKYQCISRHVALPASDQLIGYAVGKQYVYTIMLEGGISTVRLLPRGFSDGSVMYAQQHQIAVPSLAAGPEDWGVLGDLLSEMVASGLPKTPVFQSLHKAFELFSEKDMVNSAKELKEIHKMNDQELTRVVAQFLNAIIDYSDAANKTDTELHAKRVLTSRMNLFLKHMAIFDRMMATECPVMRGGVSVQRVGPIMLGEVSERVAATAAIWKWKCTNEANAAIFDVVIEKVLRIPEVSSLGLKDKDALFGRCNLLHLIPVVAAQQLDKKILTKTRNHRLEIFHSVCDLLMDIREAIISWRKTRIAVPKIILWWTVETFVDSYRQVAERIIEELKEGQASESERTRLMLYILGIYDFYLHESDLRPDNDKILQELINLGKVPDAMELAERHKDFGLLIKHYLAVDNRTRQKTFERFKNAYRNDDFEMYLCDYLKRNGRNDVLLQQGGQRVDAYLDNFKELRYSREIANKQFGKAAHTLMSLADTETKSFEKFADFLTRAYYCACSCRDGTDVSEVVDFYKRRYPEMKHRMRIPLEILKTGYGDDLDVMMSVEEMLEWNMAHQPNDEATVQGFARAFHLLADLLVFHLDSVELKDKIEKTWKALIDYDEWTKIRNKDDVEKKTMFGKFCKWLIEEFPADQGDSFPAWVPLSRMLILPQNLELILEEATANTTGNHSSWIKGHIKWVQEQLVEKAKTPKSSFFHPDTQEVGSFAQAALEGFGPILKMRQKRLGQ